MTQYEGFLDRMNKHGQAPWGSREWTEAAANLSGVDLTLDDGYTLDTVVGLDGKLETIAVRAETEQGGQNG